MSKNLIQIDGPCLGQAELCDRILRALRDWFGIEQAIIDYVEAVKALPTFIARDSASGKPIGFLTIKEHFAHAAEVYLIAVLEEHHRSGVGRLLLERAEDYLRGRGRGQGRGRGVRFLQVKTLSPSRECEHYARTRRFYEAMGFTPLEEFPTLWGEANPCLMMVKVVG